MVHWFQFLVTAAVLLSCICQRTATDYDWDYFKFVQEWPTAICKKEEQNQECVVPPSVQTWTVHGLCILTQLETYWPNLFPDTGKYSFWAHEWEKHGTCSTNLKATHNELLYFKAALEQRQKYDLLKLLNEKGIVPSESDTYTVGEILQVLTDSLGVHTYITCVSDGYNYYLAQIKICLDKSFNLMDCEEMQTARNVSSKFKDFFDGCQYGEKTYVYYTLPPHSPWQQRIGIISV